MTEEEAMREIDRIQEQAPLRPEEIGHFESILKIRAYVLGWTGDPLCQPPTSVLAAIRELRSGIKHGAA